MYKKADKIILFDVMLISVLMVREPSLTMRSLLYNTVRWRPCDSHQEETLGSVISLSCFQQRPEIPECMSLPISLPETSTVSDSSKKRQKGSNCFKSLGQKHAFHRAGPSWYKLWIKADLFFGTSFLFANIGIRNKTWVFKKEKLRECV